MQTDAHNKGREERRALLEQRRAAVARHVNGGRKLTPFRRVSSKACRNTPAK
jgi:hypothetical protein